MPRKLPDSRPTWRDRLTGTKTYGGKGSANGGRTPAAQDTGRAFGRNPEPVRKSPPRMGPRF